MTNPDLIPISRLTKVGDVFTGQVKSCVPQKDPANGYDYVHFTFHGCEGELKIGALGVIAKLMAMGFYDKPDAANPDGVVRYDLVADERLTFARVGPVRGGNPLWRIERAAKPVAAPAPAPKPAARPVEASAPPFRRHTGVADQLNAGADTLSRRAPEKSPDEKRAAVRERFDAEAERVILEVIPRLQKAAKKKKVKLGPVTLDAVFSAASGLVIGMEKRGCA